MKESTCRVCKKTFKYDPKIAKGFYCSVKCRYVDHGNIIAQSYTPELKKLKRELAKKQMSDPDQIAIRKIKCGRHIRTEESLDKFRLSRFTDVFHKARYVKLKEGCFCTRCGKEFDSSELVLHHKDGKKWNNCEENLQLMCKPCHSHVHNEIGKLSGRFAGLHTVENYIAKILLHLGIDLDEPDFKDTPLRVARMYNELFEGVKSGKEIPDIFASKFPSTNDNMVIVKNIRVYSLCPHHLLPVTYDINIGYIPNKLVLGLSKFVRICELLARRPVLQENLTVEIVKCINKHLLPKGVIATIQGVHHCMIMRGVKQQNSVVHTSHILGVFDEASTRSEFFSLIKD